MTIFFFSLPIDLLPSAGVGEAMMGEAIQSTFAVNGKRYFASEFETPTLCGHETSAVSSDEYRKALASIPGDSIIFLEDVTKHKIACEINKSTKPLNFDPPTRTADPLTTMREKSVRDKKLKAEFERKQAKTTLEKWKNEEDDEDYETLRKELASKNSGLTRVFRHPVTRPVNYSFRGVLDDTDASEKVKWDDWW